jgi:tetratricopeptide (TPR) repeat protein
MKVALAALALLAAVRAQDGFAARYAAAQELRERGADPAAVRAAYRDALRAFESEAPAGAERRAALPGAAFSACQAGEYEAAWTLFAESRELGNRDAFHAEWGIWALARDGRGADALRLAWREREAFPQEVARAVAANAAVVLPAADRRLRAGETELGAFAFRLLAAAAETPATLANLALALRHAGDVGAAEAAYRRALALAPNDSLLWNDLGLLLKGAGRTGEALAALRRSVAVDPEPAGCAALLNLAVLGAGADRPGFDTPALALARRLEQHPDAGAGFARRLALDVALGTRWPARAASEPDKQRPNR